MCTGPWDLMCLEGAGTQLLKKLWQSGEVHYDQKTEI